MKTVWRTRGPVVVAVGMACAIHPPILTEAAVGCFEVTVSGWTDEIRQVIRDDPPPVIRLDSAFANYGTTWRRGWPNDRNQRIQWTNVYSDWRLIGDTVIPVPYGPDYYHVLGQDSIILGWMSRRGRGGVTMFLEKTEDGYAGLGMFYPRNRIKHVPSPRFRLRRAPCTEVSRRPS